MCVLGHIKAWVAAAFMVCVQVINQFLGHLHKRSRLSKPAPECGPVRGMGVFTDIDAILGHVVKHVIKGGDLLRHCVATVVEQDIDARECILQFVEEVDIFLVTDKYLDLILFQLATSGVNVDAIDPGFGSEVVLPHL